MPLLILLLSDDLIWTGRFPLSSTSSTTRLGSGVFRTDNSFFTIGSSSGKESVSWIRWTVFGIVFVVWKQTGEGVSLVKFPMILFRFARKLNGGSLYEIRRLLSMLAYLCERRLLFKLLISTPRVLYHPMLRLYFITIFLSIEGRVFFFLWRKTTWTLTVLSWVESIACPLSRRVSAHATHWC